jgi:hypothetical protein
MSMKRTFQHSDLGPFARRLPAIILAAVLAQLSGDLGTAVVRALTGMSGSGSSAIVERVLTVGFALALPTLILSHWFAPDRWSWPEAFVVASSTFLSFWSGPLLYGLGDLLFRVLTGGGSIQLRGNYGTSLFWAVGIAIVIAPAEYFVWTSSARARMRAVYSRIRKSTVDVDSSDPVRAARVRQYLTNVTRVETSETARLGGAMRTWYRIWLDHPEGTFDESFAEPADAVDREAEALYRPSAFSERLR